jgi:hypothetical protein
MRYLDVGGEHHLHREDEREVMIYTSISLKIGTDSKIYFLSSVLRLSHICYPYS